MCLLSDVFYHFYHFQSLLFPFFFLFLHKTLNIRLEKKIKEKILTIPIYIESSKKKIIFATFSQAHEGLDIPTLDTVILATPKSDIVQSIGRIMRDVRRS